MKLILLTNNLLTNPVNTFGDKLTSDEVVQAEKQIYTQNQQMIVMYEQ